jgi:pectate lyase
VFKYAPVQVAFVITLLFGSVIGLPRASAQQTYVVENLNDSGPGSLRDAVSKGNRHVIFDVAGEIKLESDIYVNGAFITIDGSTAPPPGITLKNYGLRVYGKKGAHDVIIQGIRIRELIPISIIGNEVKGGLGILISFGAYNIVVDRVSIAHAGDGPISVTKGAHDITISYSIFAENKYSEDNTLISIFGPTEGDPTYNTRRVTMHHNLIMEGSSRMPKVAWSRTGEQAPELMLDMRNNLIWDWLGSATQILQGAKANVVDNYYYNPGAKTKSQKRAIYFCHEGSTKPQCDGPEHPELWARAYIAGNISGAGWEVTDYLNSLGTESRPFDAPFVDTTDACTAAHEVLADAGVSPLDAIDEEYLSQISLPMCSP